MICPECGERYNFYEPQCPWCGAAKPVPEKKLPDGKSRQQLEDKPAAVEDEEEYLTYKSRKKKYYSPFEIVARYVGGILCTIIGVSLLFSMLEESTYVAGVIFLVVAVGFFWDAFHSLDVVREIKWYKDRFVLCTCYEEEAFYFDKAKPYKIDTYLYLNLFPRKVFIFRKKQKKFYIYETEFPELGEAMKRLYFGKG